MAHLAQMLLSDLLVINELAERVTVHIIGDYAHAQSRHFLEIVDHHDVGMAEIVAHIKFALYHLLHRRVFTILLLEGFEHYPLAMLLGSVHIIKLLVPQGQVLNFGPFLVLSHKHLG